ncbi:MAG: hypothetical protein M3Y08_17565 [Fibrobacterota bacterium]|nr:hypothetical protein [Fibrobacterota bacterium]
MFLRIACLFLLAVIVGCIPDRLSGTEVGNPEITVSARFGFIEDDTLAFVSSMEMRVMQMDYRIATDSTRRIWEYPAGMEVNLAIPGSAANLPTVKVRNANWTNAELLLAARDGDSTLPDSSSYSSFSNPRFIKLTKKMNGDSVRFLFEVPSEMHLMLRFDEDRVARWRVGNNLSVAIIFDCGRWTSAISGNPFQGRVDGEGKPYVLLSRKENSEIHEKLSALFPECFISDSVEML